MKAENRPSDVRAGWPPIPAPVDVDRIERAIREVLVAAGADRTSKRTVMTSRRVARWYAQTFFGKRTSLVLIRTRPWRW